MCLRVTRSAGPDGSPADVAPAVRTHFAFVARRFGPHTADLGPSATEGVCHLKEIPAGDASAEEGVFPIGVVLSYKLHDYAEPLDWGKRAEVYSRYSLLQFETGESETVSLSLSSLAEAEARGVPETPPPGRSPLILTDVMDVELRGLHKCHCEMEKLGPKQN